jgi:hypothetical protein
MRWRKLGRLFSVEQNHPWMWSHCAVPFCARIDQNTYRVYFSPRDRQGRATVCWFDIDIRNPARPTQIGDRPLLEHGKLGCFDDNGAMVSWIVQSSREERLYYTGWTLGKTVPFHTAIGMATRPLGQPGAPFERACDGPIFARSPDEPYLVSNPCVVTQGGQHSMWYISGIGWDADANPPALRYVIKHARSADGVAWTPHPAVSIAHRFTGEQAIARPCVLTEKDQYKMWYSYRGSEWGYRIGYAVSADGIAWQRLDENVGIAADAEWEKGAIAYPFVFDTDDNRMMLYNGGRYGDAGIGVAVLEQD